MRENSQVVKDGNNGKEDQYKSGDDQSEWWKTDLERKVYRGLRQRRKLWRGRAVQIQIGSIDSGGGEMDSGQNQLI